MDTGRHEPASQPATAPPCCASITALAYLLHPSGALPEEAISQQRLLFGAVAHAARRIAYAHATMVAHQRGAAPAATNPGSNNNDKMNAMARETEAEADEHMEGAADQLASSTAKARKGKRGQRGGRLRTASPGGDPDKGEEEEEEAGEREKSAEAAPQVAIDPCDLIVSTEHMQGALQALLPGCVRVECMLHPHRIGIGAHVVCTPDACCLHQSGASCGCGR
eukprot:1161956-Pelagomonas_calceolata.AAC.25